MPIRVLNAALRSRLAREEGMTIVELSVALGVVLTALLALAYTATIGFADIALARQRQGATGLANEAMEQIRALPFETVRRGLNPTSFTGDTNITTCGSSSCFRGETIPTGSNPSVVPLVPHRRTVTVGPTTYTVAAYVTRYENSTTNNTLRATVIVTWANPARRGVASRAEVQSLLFSGTGCLSPANHPFAGPCQPFLYADAVGDVGRVDVTGTIEDVPLESATLWMADADSNLQVEQISSVQGLARTPGASLKLLGESEQLLGAQSVSSKADNDPTQPGNPYDTLAAPGQAAGTLVASEDANSLTLSNGGGGDTASTTSAVAAQSVNASCPDRGGVSRNDLQPCGTSSGRLAGTLSAALRIVAGTTDLGTATLSQVDPPAGGPTRYAFTNRDLTHEPAAPASECPSASGDGCVHANLHRALRQLSLGRLPSNLGAAPSGWNGWLVSITDFTDTVSAESGRGTSAPTATRSGSLSYWNGSGYTTLTLSPSSTSQRIEIPTVAVLAPGSQDGLTVSLSATIDTGTTAVQDPAACGSGCTRTSASGSSAPPVVELRYRVFSNTATFADLTVRANPGAISARTTYKAAPSA